MSLSKQQFLQQIQEPRFIIESVEGFGDVRLNAVRSDHWQLVIDGDDDETTLRLLAMSIADEQGELMFAFDVPSENGQGTKIAMELRPLRDLPTYVATQLGEAALEFNQSGTKKN